MSSAIVIAILSAIFFPEQEISENFYHTNIKIILGHKNLLAIFILG